MKMLHRDAGLATLAGLTLLTMAACGHEAPAGPDADVTALVAIAPQGGATGVDTHTRVEAEFDHPMMAGMEAYADLHQGDLTGPVVPGTWAMSDDHMHMTFTPDEPLAPHTMYTIHLGGGMMDEDDHPVGFDTWGPGMGGQWATGSMMGNGGMMGGQGPHMGDGWQNPDDGSWGMIFMFTTGD